MVLLFEETGSVAAPLGAEFVQLENGLLLGVWWPGRGQLYDPKTGAKIGDEFAVDVGSSQFELAALPGGGFAIAWNNTVGGNANDVHLHLFAADGTLLEAIDVNTVTTGQQIQADLAVSASGRIMVVWADESMAYGDTQPYSIMAAVYEADGTLVKSPFRVNTTTAGAQLNPEVVALPDGSFRVTWMTGSTESWQAYDSSGNPVGGEMVGEEYVLSNGNILVVTGNSGQILDSARNPVGDPFTFPYLVNSVSRDIEPIEGGFVVSDGSGGAVYDNSGALQGAPFRLSSAQNASIVELDGGVLIGNKLFRLDDGVGGTIVPNTTTVSENTPENVTAIELDVASAAVNGVFTYGYVSDSAGGAFTIEDNRLVVADASKLDFETSPSIDVTVVATDANGGQYTRTITVQVTDAATEIPLVAEEPAALGAAPLSPFTFAANQILELADGSKLMITTRDVPFSPADGVFVQALDADGNPVGTASQVAGALTDRTVSAVALPDGRIAIATDPGGNIELQFINAQGQMLTGPIVLDNGPLIERDQEIVRLPGGDLIVAWHDLETASIRYQRVTDTGQLSGAQSTLNSVFGNLQHLELEPLADGGFLAVWYNNDSGFRGARAQRFDASGSKVGGEYQLHTQFMSNAELAGLPSGGHVLAWTNVDGQLSFQLLDSAGQASGGVTALPFPHPVTDYDIVPLEGGRFAIFSSALVPSTFDPQLKIERVYGQVFEADGSVLIPSFLLSENPDVNQDIIDAYLGEDDTLHIFWQDGQTRELIRRDVQFPQELNPIDGTAGDDALAGGAGWDLIDGQGGNDNITGGPGHDRLLGGEGNDYLQGDLGRNELDGGPGNDDLNGGEEGEVLLGGDGDDTVLGNGGNDRIEGGAGFDVLIGGAGNDAVYGGANDDRLAGGDGEDLLDGGTGADYMHGGLGNDIFVVDDAGDSAYEAADEGIDTIRTSISYNIRPNVEHLTYTGSGFVYVQGNELSNRIDVSSSSQALIVAGEGDDIVIGGAGADSLAGGLGDDHLFGGGGDDYLQGDAGENHLDGGAGNDQLNGGDDAETLLGGDGDDLLLGNGGDDRLEGGAGLDILVGGAGNDLIFGGAEADRLAGGDGDDYLDGGTGRDYMHGGAGNDTFVVDDPVDWIDEGAGEGIDTVLASSDYRLLPNLENLRSTATVYVHLLGNDLDNVIEGGTAPRVLIQGFGGNDTIIGTSGDDSLSGGEGDDEIFGGAGNDYLQGDAGANLLDGGDGADQLNGGDDAEILRGGNSSDTVLGNGGDDTIEGGAGPDILVGGAGNDAILGGTGDDRLDGGDGDDVLNGGAGSDYLVGSAGADRFTFDQSWADGAYDIVVGFTRADGDLIDLSAVDADTGTAGDQAFTYIGAAAFSGTAGELRVTGSPGSYLAEADVNGDGVTDMLFIFENLAEPIGAGDFVL